MAESLATTELLFEEAATCGGSSLAKDNAIAAWSSALDGDGGALSPSTEKWTDGAAASSTTVLFGDRGAEKYDELAAPTSIDTTEEEEEDEDDVELAEDPIGLPERLREPASCAAFFAASSAR